MKSYFIRFCKLCSVSIFVFFIVGISSQVFLESTWFTSSIAYVLNKDNFHEVVPKKVFRSGQLNKEELAHYVNKYNIKTVIDLRKSGDKENEQRFSERKLLTSLGVEYEWIPMVGSNTRQYDSIEKFISLSEEKKEPLLIHCSSGTHRTGVMTAIWLMINNEMSPEEAIKQLSPEYGYFYWERRFKSLLLGHQTVDAILWEYISQYKQSHIDFKNWFFNDFKERQQSTQK